MIDAVFTYGVGPFNVELDRHGKRLLIRAKNAIRATLRIERDLVERGHKVRTMWEETGSAVAYILEHIRLPPEAAAVPLVRRAIAANILASAAGVRFKIREVRFIRHDERHGRWEVEGEGEDADGTSVGNDFSSSNLFDLDDVNQNAAAFMLGCMRSYVSIVGRATLTSQFLEEYDDL